MVVNSSARATGAGARLFEVLDAEPAIRNAPDAQPLLIKDGLVRFEHVDFRYAGSNRNALTDINLELRPGEILGIVGPPGSGKSTLAHLIPRFYDVSSGRITIDGTDVRQLTVESLRDQIALVQQDTFLFDTTVRDNVAYAEPWSEEEAVIEAASIAQIHEHVAQLPAGYDTRVGERGVALSGGQRQRMSIARALVADPAILVLDDSTAAVDAATEQLVRAALQRAVRHKATIIIAHRLSSLMHADEIIVLDQGRIAERGTHTQLVNAGGEYAALWTLQNRSADNATSQQRNNEVIA
jgi:ATP-binding cassette subfamily B protein